MGFTDEEKAAMKARAAEARAEKASAKRADKDAANLQDVLDRIAEMEDDDRALAERVHELVTAAAPQLAPKTWYGMPAYTRDDKVVCFFQSAAKFKTRYCTFGFQDSAQLDNGTFWPTAFALTKVDRQTATAITDLVRRAAG